MNNQIRNLDEVKAEDRLLEYTSPLLEKMLTRVFFNIRYWYETLSEAEAKGPSWDFMADYAKGYLAANRNTYIELLEMIDRGAY
jgi:hypothetical protein